MRQVNVLLTSAGLATAVNVISALRQSSFFKAKIIAVDMSPLSGGLYLADCCYEVPPVSDPQYLKSLIQICKQERVDFIFPLFSGEIELIARNANRFVNNHSKVMVPDPDIVSLCNNKTQFLHFLERNNYPYPKTYNKNELNQASFPLFIKPVSGSSSRNTFIIKSREELSYNLTKFTNSIVQNFVDGIEYTIDCLMYNGKVYVCSPRSRLSVKDGKSIVGKTLRHEPIESLVKNLLIDIGINGPCNVQCIEDDRGNLYLIEINPRLAAGGLPLTVRAGANIPEMMLKLALGMKVKPIKYVHSDIIMIRYLEEVFLQCENNQYKRI